MASSDAPVIYGYDGSPAAIRAIQKTAPLFAPRAALVVTVYDAKFTYLTAIPDLVPAPIDIRAAIELDEAMYDHSRQLATQGARIARDGGLDADPLVVADTLSVTSTLVRLASERQAGAITVGTHGHHAARELLLGSTTRELLRKASTPVMAVRGPKGEGSV